MKKEKANKRVMQIGDMVLKPIGGNKVVVTIANAKTIVDYKDLWGAIFVLSDKERQDAMMPVRKEERMIFSRKHVIEASKDIKKGEKINVWCEVSIPKTIVEAIAEENGAKVIYQKEDKSSLSTAS
jgi:hypothetical protein